MQLVVRVHQTLYEGNQLHYIGLRLIWWQTYSLPNGHVLWCQLWTQHENWHPIMFRWLTCLFKSWTPRRNYVFNADLVKDFFSSHLKISFWMTAGCNTNTKIYSKALVSIITGPLNRTSSKFQCCFWSVVYILSKFPTLSVSAADGSCLQGCLCITSLVSVQGGICHTKEWNWEGKSSYQALQLEQKKMLMLLSWQHLLSLWYKWTKGF